MQAVPPELEAEIDFFLFGGRRSIEQLKSVPEEVLASLQALGLIEFTSDKRLTMGKLSIIKVLGIALVCQRPSVRQSIYFGQDSMGLLARLSATPDMKALDLCTGPGIQAIHLARMVRSVVAVDINPVAAALAKLNFELNATDCNFTSRCGDLFAATKNECFDLICANPPLVVVPNDLEFPFVGHGGPDGLAVTRRILSDLPRMMSDRAVSHLIGMTISDGFLPICSDEIDSWAARHQMSVVLSVLHHLPAQKGASMYDALVKTCCAAGGVESQLVTAAYDEMLIRQEATHFCTFALQVARSKQGKMQILDFSGARSPTLWFA